MHVLLENIPWMAFNVFLAVAPIGFGYLALTKKNLVVRLLSGLVWFFFLPNTIYLTTDIIHFLEDAAKTSGLFLAIDLVLYVILIILGVITYIMAVDPFEKLLFKDKSKNERRQNLPFIYILNFFVGFGVVLGRVHRLNSWDIVINTDKVIYYSLETLRSVQLMILVLAFMLLSQVVYMKFRKSVPKVVF